MIEEDEIEKYVLLEDSVYNSPTREIQLIIGFYDSYDKEYEKVIVCTDDISPYYNSSNPFKAGIIITISPFSYDGYQLEFSKGYDKEPDYSTIVFYRVEEGDYKTGRYIADRYFKGKYPRENIYFIEEPDCEANYEIREDLTKSPWWENNSKFYPRTELEFIYEERTYIQKGEVNQLKKEAESFFSLEKYPEQYLTGGMTKIIILYLMPKFLLGHSKGLRCIKIENTNPAIFESLINNYKEDGEIIINKNLIFIDHYPLRTIKAEIIYDSYLDPEENINVFPKNPVPLSFPTNSNSVPPKEIKKKKSSELTRMDYINIMRQNKK